MPPCPECPDHHPETRWPFLTTEQAESLAALMRLQPCPCPCHVAPADDRAQAEVAMLEGWLRLTPSAES